MRGGDYQGDKQGVGRYGEDRAFHERYDSKGYDCGGFVRKGYGIMVKAGEHGGSFMAGFCGGLTGFWGECKWLFVLRFELCGELYL